MSRLRCPMPPLASVTQLCIPADLSQSSLEWAITLLGEWDGDRILYVPHHLEEVATDLMMKLARDETDVHVCCFDGTFLDCGKPNAWGVSRHLREDSILPEFGHFLVWTTGV